MMTSPALTSLILLTTFLIYLIQDGRALMLCVCAPFCDRRKRALVFNDILPSWDANQTWLVFTIAGLYGAFPAFFGWVMSENYLFFLSMLLFFMLRGAAIEFYIKSTRYKQWWLIALAAFSLILIIFHVLLIKTLLNKLMPSKNITNGLASFIFFYYFTLAYCYLFKLTHLTRSCLVAGLFVTSAYLFSESNAVTWQSSFTAWVFTIRLTCLAVFIITSIFRYPPSWFGTSLLYMLFMTNALFVLFEHFMKLPFPSADQVSTTYLIINGFSIVLLPLIAISLSQIKKVFKMTSDELSY